MPTQIDIIVRAPTGSGKSAILGEIENTMKAIGVPVRYADAVEARGEKNITGADWMDAIEMYEPEVTLHEENQPMWGRWYAYSKAPAGSYACLYTSDGKTVEQQWMPHNRTPHVTGLVMPFLMPSDPLAQV